MIRARQTSALQKWKNLHLIMDSANASIDEHGYFVTEDEDLGKAADDIHKAIECRSNPFGEEAGILFWANDFGFKNSVC